MTITIKDIWTIRLTTVGNPDFGQYSPITDPETATAETLPELKEKIREWQNFWQVGGGNWTDPIIRKNGKPVGTMSYNCRIWKLEMKDMTMNQQKEKYGDYFPKELEVLGDNPDADEAPLKTRRFHVGIPYIYNFYVDATTEEEAIEKAHNSGGGSMGEYDETNIFVEEIPNPKENA